MQNKLINSSVLSGNKLTNSLRNHEKNTQKTLLEKSNQQQKDKCHSKYSPDHITSEICIFNFNKAVYQ